MVKNVSKKQHKSINESINQFKRKITFPILKQPEAIKSLKTKIIIVTIIATFILDALSFSLKGSQVALEHNMLPLSIFMLMLYFGQRIIESSYATYSDLQNDIFKQIYSAETTQLIMNICNITRAKVFKKEDNKETIMEDSEIIEKLKWYIDAVWNFWWRIPAVISECTILVSMIAVMIFFEFKDSANKASTIFIMFFLFLCIIIYFILGKRRISLKNDFRKKIKDAYAGQEVIFNELKNIDFISQNDFDYHAQRLRYHILNSTELAKNERLKLNNVFIQRSAIASGFMVIILLIKIFAVSTINFSVILDIVAISSIYSTILSKIGSILNQIELIADNIIDINTLYPDFQNIYNILLEEKTKTFSEENVDRITVEQFSATQDPKKRYLLKNGSSFELKKGDFVLVKGPTGCGKSTLLFLLTGKLRIDSNPIKFSNGDTGYLKSIAYQTDKSMANNFVINELILDDDVDKTDRKKLFEILHGLCLYPELLRMANADNDINGSALSDDDKVIELLKLKKTNQFSSGQKQRLSLAKLLYTMTADYQVIALDEAFNRLDDKTAEACISFVYEYTQRDMPRIVLLATHQVDLIKKICNKEISFVEELNISNMYIS